MQHIQIMLRLIWLLCAMATFVAACKRSGSDKINGGTSGDNPPLVSLCNEIDYADTAALHDKKVMTARIISIVRLLPRTDSLTAKKALSVFFNGLKKDEAAMEMAAGLAKHYLGNPASPARNETLYIQFLQSMLSTDSLPETVRSRSKENLRVALLNRPGTIATNFKFIDRNGNHMSLHDLTARQTLLVFYDPECHHCSDILTMLAKATNINSAIQKGDLTVLAIYAEGNRKLWEKTSGEMPQNWKVGYDVTGILDNDLYDLPAMPVIYLLDSNKRVILKDPNAPSLCR